MGGKVERGVADVSLRGLLDMFLCVVDGGFGNSSWYLKYMM